MAHWLGVDVIYHTCSIQGCLAVPITRGRCERHYWLEREELFFNNVEQDDEGCWIWKGSIASTGYGQFWCLGQGLAHRWSYEYFVGPIPEGLQLDHLCRVRHCVNPAHLEPVTLAENVLRGAGLSALNVTRTHCAKGHPLDGRVAGYRCCNICRVANTRAWRARKRAARLAEIAMADSRA